MLLPEMWCTFYMLGLQGLLECNSSPFWTRHDPWYGYSAAHCVQSEREASEGFLASHYSPQFGSVRSLVVFLQVCMYEKVWVYIYMWDFSLCQGEYGFEKANLGLRALGPCQAHRPISHIICYRTATTYAQTCNQSNPSPTPGSRLFPVNSHWNNNNSSCETLWL